MIKIIMIPAAAAAAVTAAGLPNGRIDVTYYEIGSPKLKAKLRLVILADLHDEDYGKQMEHLTEKIIPLNPDMIMIPGDLCEEKKNDEHSMCLLNRLKDYPVFYSTGNHEEHRPDLPDLLSKIRATGAHVPETEAECIEIRGNELEILSLPCLKKEYDYIPEDVNRRFHTDRYRIMLSHRPSWIDLYNSTECDLILSGHAHGGQWRIPALHRGLIAPSAGFFPKYTEGVHELNGKKMVISRGLTKKTHGVIRLYNNPEIVVLDLIPEVNNAEETAA